MTEEEWLKGYFDSEHMLELVEGKASDRKLRLFACACCRRIWPSLDEVCRRGVVASEGFADGLVVPDELRVAHDAICAEIRTRYSPTDYVTSGEILTVCCVAKHAASSVACNAPSDGTINRIPSWDYWEHGEAKEQLKLWHDITGDLTCPVTLDPAWLTSTVVALAHGIYADHAFDRLPILADALQDSGCENEDILNHCRGPGPHVRGCWVVDLVLGKS